MKNSSFFFLSKSKGMYLLFAKDLRMHANHLEKKCIYAADMDAAKFEIFISNVWL